MFSFMKSKKEALTRELETLQEEIGSANEKLVDLRTDKRTLEEEVHQLKHEHKLEKENIKHMVKIKEEKNEVELAKKEVALEREKHDEIEKIKDEYRDKLEKFLTKQIADQKDTHEKLMEHMPKIEAMFGNGDLKKKSK